ncbi:MAG: class I SAM-dependent methyltransferase [Betaproteobacteria bacterium]|nr:class I SAM-dependent methyltransferase [Betaproteobacteria bacterium]
MKIYRLRNHGEYLAHTARDSQRLLQHQATLNTLVPDTKKNFTVSGYSYTAGHDVQFLVDFQHSGTSGKVIWRERVCCPETGFNNRMRATFHIFDLEMEAYPDSAIYVTEQVTPIYKYFAERYSNVTGSEYLGGQTEFGGLDANGIRNETLCNLSFPSETFDIIVSLDVLEHIPDYLTAFKECSRVLKPGGRLLWSVPFVPSSEENIIRARLKDGEIEHLLPAEYHGDPLSQAGVLCFTHFGWEMLEQIKAAGFKDAYAACFHSLEFGYLGGEQFIFIARK